MKKLFMILFCLMILPMCALAEEAAPIVDVTDVVIAALVLAATAVRIAWKKWIRPWLEKKKLLWLTAYADEAVMLAEAFIGRGLGSEKWKYALAKMSEYGFAVNSTAVTDALLAAWKRLDLLQIDAGEKKPSNNNTGGDADA